MVPAHVAEIALIEVSVFKKMNTLVNKLGDKQLFWRCLGLAYFVTVVARLDCSDSTVRKTPQDRYSCSPVVMSSARWCQSMSGHEQTENIGRHFDSSLEARELAQWMALTGKNCHLLLEADQTQRREKNFLKLKLMCRIYIWRCLIRHRFLCFMIWRQGKMHSWTLHWSKNVFCFFIVKGGGGGVCLGVGTQVTPVQMLSAKSSLTKSFS